MLSHENMEEVFKEEEPEAWERFQAWKEGRTGFPWIASPFPSLSLFPSSVPASTSSFPIPGLQLTPIFSRRMLSCGKCTKLAGCTISVGTRSPVSSREDSFTFHGRG
jgi:hypothetical protein